MQPSPSHDDLAALVRERREAMRLGRRKAAAAGGMAAMTWNRVEDGKPVQRLTYAGIEKALRWPQGSIDRYLETGEAPVALPDAEPEPGEGPGLHVATYEQLIDELRRRHEADRAELARRLGQHLAPDAPLTEQRLHLAENDTGETAESVRARGGIPGLPLEDRGAEGGRGAQEGQA